MIPSSVRTSTSRSGAVVTTAALVPSANFKGTRTARVVTARKVRLGIDDAALTIVFDLRNDPSNRREPGRHCTAPCFPGRWRERKFKKLLFYHGVISRQRIPRRRHPSIDK